MGKGYKTFSENISSGSRGSGSGRSKTSARSIDSFAVPRWSKDSKIVQAMMIKRGCNEGTAINMLNTLQINPAKFPEALREELYAVVKSGICGATK